MTGKRVEPIWSAAAGGGGRRRFPPRAAALRGPRRHIKTFLTHQKVRGVTSATTSKRSAQTEREEVQNLYGPISPALFFLEVYSFPLKKVCVRMHVCVCVCVCVCVKRAAWFVCSLNSCKNRGMCASNHSNLPSKLHSFLYLCLSAALKVSGYARSGV